MKTTEEKRDKMQFEQKGRQKNKDDMEQEDKYEQDEIIEHGICYEMRY